MEKARDKNKRERVDYTAEQLIAFAHDKVAREYRQWAIIEALKILINEL
jgi:hypothetical protein